MGIETALIGGALGSVYSANKQSKAAKSAADAQAQAANQANSTELQIYNQSREDMAPWRDAGNNALAQLMRLQGFEPKYSTSTTPGYTIPGNKTADRVRQAWGDDFLNSYTGKALNIQNEPDQVIPGTEKTTMNWEYTGNTGNALASDPGYKFRVDQGNNALTRALASRGMLNSGQALKEALRLNQGYASDEYQNAYNRLAGLAGTGQSATQQMSQYGQNYANQYSQNLGQAANARASAYGAKAQATGNAISDIMGLGTLYGINQGWFKGK